MATKNCPRCKVSVHSTKDKSKRRWQWSKKKNTYVCLACEAELVAKETKRPLNYTMSIERGNTFTSFKLDLKGRRSKCKKKLCIQCGEVTFLIGVRVWQEKAKPVVCSNKCRLRYRKAEKEAVLGGGNS